ncbi:MAG: hypothetical protein NZ932_04675 [Candidatus Bathyarchaeota archaeon]|nr:hypothetical protein [Candidatus Bathyarchaeota archaeon]
MLHRGRTCAYTSTTPVTHPTISTVGNKTMKNCPHQTVDNKGYTNCKHGDNQCPYKAASSASKQKCSTSADKLVLSCVQRKRRAERSVKRLLDVLHFSIDAVGVGVYA